MRTLTRTKLVKLFGNGKRLISCDQERTVPSSIGSRSCYFWCSSTTVTKWGNRWHRRAKSGSQTTASRVVFMETQLLPQFWTLSKTLYSNNFWWYKNIWIVTMPQKSFNISRTAREASKDTRPAVFQKAEWAQCHFVPRFLNVRRGCRHTEVGL